MKLNSITRIIFSLFLCYGIYNETGICTLIFAITMLGYVEIDFYIKETKKKIDKAINKNITSTQKKKSKFQQRLDEAITESNK